MNYELTLVLVIAAAALLFALPFILRRHRGLRDRETAGKLGYGFQGRIPADFYLQLQAFELLHGAQEQDVYNLLFRVEGNRQYAVFSVDVGHIQRETISRNLRVFFAAGEDFTLPRFRLRPKNLGHRIDREPDINFPQDPVFSRRFLLQGYPEEAVRALFHPRFRGYLRTLREVELESRQNRLIVTHPRRIPISRLVREGEEIVRLIAEDPGIQ